MLCRHRTAGRVIAVALALTLKLSAQQSAPTGDLAKVLSMPPSVTPLRAGKRSVGTLKVWRVTDAASPLFGLTLCAIVLDRAAVEVNFDSEARLLGDRVFEDFSKPPIVVVSGGPWSGAPGAEWKKRTAAGLVIVGTSQLRRAEPSWNAGGVFSGCGTDLAIDPKKDYDRQVQLAKVSVIRSCNRPDAFALQSKLLLVDKGKVPVALDRDPPANRVAIGLGGKSLIIGGAFNESNFALETRDFAAFLSKVASLEKLTDFRAVNLDGGCGAQVYFPAAKLPKFGCKGDNYSANRFLIKAR